MEIMIWCAKIKHICCHETAYFAEIHTQYKELNFIQILEQLIMTTITVQTKNCFSRPIIA